MRMILRKLAFYVVTAVAAVTVDFFIPHAMPGNPVEAVLARLQGNFTPATIKALELAYGINTNQSLLGQLLGPPAARQPGHLHQQLPGHGDQRDRQRTALDARPGGPGHPDQLRGGHPDPLIEGV